MHDTLTPIFSVLPIKRIFVPRKHKTRIPQSTHFRDFFSLEYQFRLSKVNPDEALWLSTSSYETTSQIITALEEKNTLANSFASFRGAKLRSASFQGNVQPNILF